MIRMGFVIFILFSIGCPQKINLNSGLGLGTFLRKTLLERQLANLSFSQDKELGGAAVTISWKAINIQSSV